MRIPNVATKCLASLLAAAPLAAQSTWTVDAMGTGDFTDLQVALNTVAAGDVLLLLPGSYGQARITQTVSILGDPDQPRPRVSTLDVEGAERVTLLHLEAKDSSSRTSLIRRSSTTARWDRAATW